MIDDDNGDSHGSWKMLQESFVGIKTASRTADTNDWEVFHQLTTPSQGNVPAEK